MADIRFYDFDFHLLHIQSRFTSANWTVYYNGIGTFELHCSGDDTNLIDTVMNHPYLVAVQGDLQAVVTGRQLGGKEAVLYGKTVNYLLYNGVTPDFDGLKGDVETLSRKFVSESCDFVTLGEKVGFENQYSFWRNTYHPTFDVVKDCLDLDQAGHRLFFDRKGQGWVFTVLKGRENPITLSYGNRNISELSYTWDSQNAYTGGWFSETQEQGETGETNEPVWKYITKDESAQGVYKRSAVLTATNETEAREELEKKTAAKETKVTAQKIRYQKDYELGDIVKTVCQFGGWTGVKRARVTGVSLWYQSSDTGEKPILEVM